MPLKRERLDTAENKRRHFSLLYSLLFLYSLQLNINQSSFLLLSLYLMYENNKIEMINLHMQARGMMKHEE